MAKESGIGARLLVDGFDLSGDIGAVQNIRGGPALLELTDITQPAHHRVGGLYSGEIAFNAWWDTAVGASHDVLSDLPLTDRQVMYLHRNAFGEPAAAMPAKQVNYDPTRGQDGSLAATVQALSTGTPLDWCELLTTGLQTFASAGAGTSLDDGAQSVFGAAAYLQALSIASGTATVAIQDSADGSTGWTNVTGLVFTAVAARAFQRLETARNATIRRHLRVNVTGTFTNLVAVVAVNRYQTAA